MIVKQLRIGNSLMAPDGTLVYVDEIIPNIIKCKSLTGVDYWMDSQFSWAIPLTNEWLVKLGFAKVGDVFTYTNGSVSLKFTGKELCFQINLNSVQLAYPGTVHNLQNLYFALTGNDLVIQERNDIW